jgi:hypothetical protein
VERQRRRCAVGEAAQPQHCERVATKRVAASTVWCESATGRAASAARTHLCASCVSDSARSSSRSAGGTYAAGKVAASQRDDAGASFGSGGAPSNAGASNAPARHGSLAAQMRAVERRAGLSEQSARQRMCTHPAQQRLRRARTPASEGWRTTAARRYRRCRLPRQRCELRAAAKQARATHRDEQRVAACCLRSPRHR